MTTAIEGGEGSASSPGRSLSPGKTRSPLYRRLGGPQDRSGQMRKISPPPGFDPRTVQPVASRCTDYATRPTVAYRALSCYGNLLASSVKLWEMRTFVFTDAEVSCNEQRLEPWRMRVPIRTSHAVLTSVLFCPASKFPCLHHRSSLLWWAVFNVTWGSRRPY